MLANDYPDACQIQAFEEELETYFQEVPELHKTLVSYVEARSRLYAKRKNRGFWPVVSGGSSSKGRGRFGGGKGKTKGRASRDHPSRELLLRISKSSRRLCGKRGHRKAECPERFNSNAPVAKADASASIAEVFHAVPETTVESEVHDEPPENYQTLEEALVTNHNLPGPTICSRLASLVESVKARQLALKMKQTPVDKPSLKAFRAPDEAKVRSRMPESPSKGTTEYAMTTCSGKEARVLAILDTRACRCVMGASISPRFLSQLTGSVRGMILNSQVKFRFGNNQTLTSQKRIMLPMRVANGHLWLGIEIVPGVTPLLFSKRAIQQLGGIIDLQARTFGEQLS